MSRTTLAVCLGAWLTCAGAACTHIVETRAITHFTEALRNEDFAALKSTSSKSFEHKALRIPESVDDLKILDLRPGDEVSIVKVEDVSEQEKHVTVEVGERKKRLLYHLVKDSESGRWLVDDIVVSQKKKGLKVAKSVTEQMDLFLTVREFLSACKNGEREETLVLAEPKFAELLEQLPAPYFARLVGHVAAEPGPKSDSKPVAQLDGKQAIIRVPRSSGDVILSMTMQDGRWKVADVAVESRDAAKQVPSLQKSASATNAALSFLTAYESGDKTALSRLCTPKMFDLSLKHADLTNVPLPSGQVMHEGYQLHMHRELADFVIPGEQDTFKITLDRIESEDPEVPSRFLVRDVTIYDELEEKRLSALFTAQAIMQIFSEALISHELAMIRETSTNDFNSRVWNRVDAEQAAHLAVPEIEDVTPKVLSTVFHGAVVEITVMQGTRALTYVLREHGGQVQVDDVLMPVLGRPNSLKETLEAMLPVIDYADALQQAASYTAEQRPLIERLQRRSSNDFNRLVWKQVDRVPDLTFEAISHLRTPLTTLRRSDDKAVLMLGDDRFGAQVFLVREYSHFVVDEVLLVSGPEDRHRLRLKHTLRLQLADGTLSRSRWSHAANTPTSVAAEAGPHPLSAPAPAAVGQEVPLPSAPAQWPEIPVTP